MVRSLKILYHEKIVPNVCFLETRKDVDNSSHSHHVDVEEPLEPSQAKGNCVGKNMEINCRDQQLSDILLTSSSLQGERFRETQFQCFVCCP